MAASPYGLSIVLDFEDNASDGMNSAAGAFSNLSGSADALTMGIGGLGNSLLNMNTSVVGMSVMGSQLQNMGQGMLGTLGNVANKVIDTSSTFENFGITLKALYGSEEEANRVTNDLFQFATKSPFEVEDLTGMVLTLKSQGLEAFDTITNAATGAQHSTMEWIGNLQAFRPDESALKWKLAIQNFLAGDNTQSAMRLRNILDVGELGDFIGHDLGKTVEERMQSLTDIVEKLGIGDLMTNMQATWGVTLANMDDAWSQFAYRIGYGNKDSNLYKSATQVMQNLLSAETDLFTNQGVIDATTRAFDGLVKPFLGLSNALANVAPAMSNWLGQHPQLIKWATGLTAVGGAGIYATGSLLKLSAGALNWILNVQRLGGLSGIMTFLGDTLSVLSTRMIGMGAVAGLGFLTWKTNLFGLRDALTSLGGQVREVFETTLVDLEDGKTLTQSLADQGLFKFSVGLSLLEKTGREAAQSLYNGFGTFFNMFGANIKPLTESTFNFKNMLNNIGDNIIQKFGGKNIDTFQQKYGRMLSTVGTLGASFLSATAASTAFAGAIRFLNGTGARLLTNFKLIGSTLMSPTGLLGMGLTLFTLGYTRNFLGLQELTHKIVEGLKSGMKELQGAGKIVADIFGGGKDGTKLAEKYGLQEFETGLYRVRKTALSFGTSIIQGMKNSGTGIGKILTEMFPDNVDLSIQGILNSIGRLGNKVAEFFGLDLGTGSISEKFEVLGQKIGGVITKAALLLPAFKGFQTLMQNNINPLALTGILKGLSMIRDGASTTFNALKTGFSGVITAVTSMLPNLTRFWSGIFHDFLQSGRRIIGGDGENGGLAGIFRNAFSQMGNRAQHQMDRIQAVLRGRWQNLQRDIGTRANDLVTGLRNNFATNGDILQFLRDRADSIGQFFESSFNAFTSWVRNNAGEVVNAVNQVSSNIGMGIVRAVGGIAASIQMIKWQATFNVLTSGVQMFMGALGGAIKMVMGLNVAAVGLAALSSTVLSFGTLTTSDWTELSDRIKEQPTLLNKAGVAWTWFNEKLAGTTTKVNDFFAKFDISGGVSKVLDFVSKLGSSFASIIGGSHGNNGLADFGGRLISQLVKGLANGANGLGASIQQIITSVTSSIQTYAPQIGSSLGQLIGRAFQFAGRNAPAIIESAFTIMESFVKGLWENRNAIMDGAFRIIDALCQGIITHGPEIIGYVGQLIDYFVSGLQNRSGEIGQAANALINPIMNIIQAEGPKLWDIGRSVFGHLMGIIAEEITKGLANILAAMATAAGVIGGVIALIGGALMAVPGMQPIATGLLMTAGQLEGFAIAAGSGSAALHLLSGTMGVANDTVTQYNQTLYDTNANLGTLVDHSGNFVRTSSGAIRELGGSIDELNNKQGVLKDLWAKGETVHKVTFTESGAEDIQYKVERIKNEDGTWEYKLVVKEDEPNAEALLKKNQQAGESSPITQKLKVDGDGSKPDDSPFVKKDWLGRNYEPDYSNIDYTSQETAQASRDKANYLAQQANQMKSWAEGYNKDRMVELGFQFKQDNHPATLDRYWQQFTGSFDYSAFSGAVNNRKAAESGVNQLWDVPSAEKSNVIKRVAENYRELAQARGQLSQTLMNKPEDWTITGDQAQRIMELTQLTNSFTGAMGESVYGMDQYHADIMARYQSLISEISGSPIRYHAELVDGEWKIVEDKVEELDGKESNVKVGEEGAEKTKSELDGVKDKADEVDGTEAKANVSQDGAEETSAAAKETQKAINEIPDVKNTTIEANTGDNGASVEQVAKAVENFPTEDKTVHVHVVTDLNSLSVIGGLKTAMEGLPESKNVTLGVSVTEGVAEQVQSLKTAIEEVPTNTSVSVIETGAAESKVRVDALRTSIESLHDKSVSVTASVSGKDAVDALASAIAAVHDKSVTITATTVEQKGGAKATGGVVTASEAFTLMNEQGGEIVDLPTGSRVYPHDDSVAMSYQDGYNQALVNQATQQMIASSPTTGSSASGVGVTQSTPTSSNHYDYSINLGEGAIQVRVDNANGEADYKAAAEKMWKHFIAIQKRNQMARR